MHIEDIKRLRQQTHRSILEIKRALEVHHGDFELAKADLLSGFHETKNNRIASKGSVSIAFNDDKAVIFELTAETDFAIKHPVFKELLYDIGQALLKLPSDDMDHLSKFTINKHPILDYIKIKSAQIGEHVELRRYESLRKNIDQSFSIYEHPDGKNACLLRLNMAHKNFQTSLAMQAVAMDALYISRAHLLPSDLEILQKKYEDNPGDSKSFDDYLNQKALSEQPFIKDPNQRVKDVLEQHAVSVLAMKRYTLGEGIKDKLICRIHFVNDISKVNLTVTKKN